MSSISLLNPKNRTPHASFISSEILDIFLPFDFLAKMMKFTAENSIFCDFYEKVTNFRFIKKLSKYIQKQEIIQISSN